MVSKDDAERYVNGVKTEVAVARIRERVASLLVDLAGRGLASTTLSERVPDADLFVTRPVLADDELAPENMMVVSLDGLSVPGTPGDDGVLPDDVELYAAILKDAGAVALVHLEAGHAAAWAARGAAIPCLTAQAAREFGGAVPVIAGPDVSAPAVIDSLREADAPAILVAGLGALCVAASAREAVRLAQVLEGVARTASLSSEAEPLEADLIADLSGRARARRSTITDGRR
ncbi:class II aldolase/adducin family protein [Microbacterium sp. 11MF]|uniref:class II aldolase/adducin family protein n=1 Tax=Microbacterium sp. 11MF TaxID=1169146 RepID=UPI00036C0390|nr:class II aldolase/adducin family protein [Microbacterium sp. 11MF]